MKKVLVVLAVTVMMTLPLNAYAIDTTPDAPPKYTHG